MKIDIGITLATALKIIVIIIALLFLKIAFGFFYIRMSHLSPDELEWATSPEKSPEKTFISSAGNKAEIKFTGKYISNTRNPFFIDGSGKSDGLFFTANAAYSWVITQDDFSFNGYFREVKEVGSDSTIYYAVLNYFATQGMETKEPETKSKTDPYEYIIKNKYKDYLPISTAKRVKIGGRIIDNCLVVDSLNGRQYKSDYINVPDNMQIVKYIISRDYGLVYYRLKHGEEFFREFK